MDMCAAPGTTTAISFVPVASIMRRAERGAHHEMEGYFGPQEESDLGNPMVVAAKRTNVRFLDIPLKWYREITFDRDSN
jgi:hypothetical protein